MEEGKLMGKAFIGLIVLVGLSVGALWWLDPATTKKTFDEQKANVENLVDSFNKK